MPGTSGILSPFCPMNSLHFEEQGEPDETLFELMEDIKRVLKRRGLNEITIEFDTPEEYYAIVNHLKHFAENDIQVYGTSKDEIALTFIQEEETIAEHERADEIPDRDDGSLEVLDLDEE